MNEITNKEPAPEFSSGYLRWLYSLTIVTLVFVFFIQPQVKSSFVNKISILTPAPFIAFTEIENYGIEEFRGTQTHPIASNKRITALISLLIFLVFAPTIALFLSKKFANEKSLEQEKLSIVKALQPSVFLIGLVFVAIIFIATVGQSFLAPSVFTKMKYDNAIDQERSMLVMDLVDVYSQIVQYYYQTEEFGGEKKNIVQRNKDGSVQSFVSLHVFGVNEKREFGTLLLERSASDSMITVYAIGNSVLTNNSYKNINNETGKIQYAIAIRPAIPSYTLRKFN